MTDSDCEPETSTSDISDQTDLTTERIRNLVKKKRGAIKRRARYLHSKIVAKKRFLAKKISKKTSKILSDCPDIDKVIEAYVQERNVGADAWRRTGVLTFDGNSKLKQKATYEGIRRHLEDVYGRKCSYGSVVELCISRNKRRRSSKRYRSVAKVTTRRARKGFTLRFNPDNHWSGALYRGLNRLQYRDGQNAVNINRDDAAGFRLDTLATNKQYSTPVVAGKDIITTRTDYVNRYPSTLQTTSYNFSGTATTPEMCAGVVKAPKVHEKNPTQHFADLEVLEKQDVFKPVFFLT